MAADIAYVVDFDGTITTKDLSSELAAYFGGSAFMEIENRYRRKEIPIKIWLQCIAKNLPAEMDLLLVKALQWADIRPGFERFLDHAAEQSRPVIIASDGFGFYIEPILEKNGLLNKIDQIYRNDTFLDSNGNLHVTTPHEHGTCTVCGNCKAAHVLDLKEKGTAVIYIGDGSNDRFGASWSDHICPRDKLAEICRENNFTYSPWIDFYDIIKIDLPELQDRSEISLCCPRGSGIKKIDNN